jgi:hypothetical protein
MDKNQEADDQTFGGIEYMSNKYSCAGEVEQEFS